MLLSSLSPPFTGFSLRCWYTSLELSELQCTLNLFMCHFEMYYNKNQADGAPLPLPCVVCSRPWHSRQAETVIVELAVSQFTV